MRLLRSLIYLLAISATVLIIAAVYSIRAETPLEWALDGVAACLTLVLWCMPRMMREMES